MTNILIIYKEGGIEGHQTYTLKDGVTVKQFASNLSVICQLQGMELIGVYTLENSSSI